MATTDNLPAIPGPPEPLGQTAQVSLRLALGYQDPAKKGAPVKTDYFVVSEGVEGEFHKAAEKFTRTYGEKPRALPIGLPGSLGSALDRRYLAFGTATPGEPGLLKARGHTNLVLEGRANGPDTLTVFPAEGEPHEQVIAGLTDPLAVELGLALYTSFRFFLPEVLGLVGFCEIRSKGKRTTDNLFTRLWPLYAQLGPLVSHVIEPTLVLRPARSTYYDAKGKRHRTSYHALDLWIPETRQVIRERLAEHRELVQSVQPLGLPPGASLTAPQTWEETVEQAQTEEALADMEAPLEGEYDPEVERIPFGDDESAEGWMAG